MAPPDVESERANKILDEQFAGGPNSTAIIVIRQSDMRSPVMTRYVLDLEQAIRNESTTECDGDAKIRCFDNITSVYSVYRQIITATAASLGPAIYDLESNVSGFAFMIYGLPYIYISVWDGVSPGVNGAAFMIYGLPSGYLQAVDGVNQTSSLLYGIPAQFAQAWAGVNGSAMLIHGVPSMYSQVWDGINGTSFMLYGIPSMFSQAWDGVNGSAMMLYGIPSMFSETWYGVNSSAMMLYGVPYMYQGTFSGVNQTAGLIYGGPAAYMQTWSALSMIPDMTTRNQMAYDQSWGVMNASISDEGQRQYVMGYHLSFHQSWNSSFNSSSPLYMPYPGTLPTVRAQAIVNVTAPIYFNFTDPKTQEQQMMAGVWRSLDIINFTEPASLNAFTDKNAHEILQSQMSGNATSPEQLALIEGYLDTFATSWNLTFYNTSTQNLTETDRATMVIGLVAQPYIDQVSATDPNMNQMLTTVLQTFNLTNWGDPVGQNVLSRQMFLSGMEDMIGGFGLSDDMEQQLWAYFDTFYQGWNASFANMSLYDTTAYERAEVTVHQVAPLFIDQVVQTPGVDPRTGLMLGSVLDAFNISNWNDTQIVNNVTNQTFFTTMQAMVGGLGLPAMQEDQLWQFYGAFYSSWTATFEGSSPEQFGTSIARAKVALEYFAPGFIEQVHNSDPLQAAMMQGVLDNFNMTTWNSTDHLNSFARFYFTNMLDSMATEMGVPEDQALEMMNYFDSFVVEWDKSFKDPVQGGLPSSKRAENAVAKAAPAYISITSKGDLQKQLFLQGVLYGFNGTNWNDTDRINEHTRATFVASLVEMSNKNGVPAEELARLQRYFDLFYFQWNASYQLLPLKDYSGNMRAEYSAKASAPGFIDETSGGNQTVKGMMLGVLGYLNITTWNDTSAINSFAYSLVRSNIEQMGAQQGLSQAELSKARDYLSSFFYSWNASYKQPSLDNVTDQTRAESVIPAALNYFVSNLSLDEEHFFRDVQAGLKYSNWNDTSRQEILSNELSHERGWSVVDGLLANMTGDEAMNDTMKQQVRGYFDLFAHNWNWSFNSSSTFYQQSGTSAKVRGKFVIDASAPEYFGFQTPKDDAGRFMRALWQNFTLDNWNDTAAAHNFSLSFIYESKFSGGNAAIRFSQSFFESVYRLGRRPTQTQIERFAEDMLRHGTLDTYPIQLPNSIVSQFLNDKNDTMIISLGFVKAASGRHGPTIKSSLGQVGKLSHSTAKALGMNSIKTYVSGSAPLDIQMQESVDNDISRIDIVTAIVILVLISLFFRSIVTPIIPLLSIGAAIMATYGVIFLVGSFFLKIHYTVITLTFTALMGAGVDYCIFIVARYKEERLKGKTKEDSIRTAVTWAGESITTSGVAVMIGFGGLSVLTFSMVQGMGVVLPIGIGIAILVALTFLPSFMMVVGDKIFWAPKFLRKGSGLKAEARRVQRQRRERALRMKAARKSMMDKDGGKVELDRERVFYFSNAVDVATKYASVIVILALLISIPTTYLVLSIQPSYNFFSGMPNTEAKEGLDVMADGFGKSRGMETKVVIDVGHPVYDNKTGAYDKEILDSVDRIALRLREFKAVQRVDPSTYSEGERIDLTDCWATLGDEWKGSCLSQSLGRQNHTIIITVVMKDEPFSKTSIDSIRAMRSQIKTMQNNEPALADSKILIGGATANMTDIENLINANMQQMRIIVIAAIFILLVIVLGSILIPATAVVSIGLSISWTLAVSLLLFQYRGMGLMWLMPIILFVVLMGLGMDYNIFIITRMREEVMRGYSDRVAIRRAVEKTGGIITACGAVMAGAFGSMMLSVMGLLQQFGFALFFAIILDAFIIRIYLMPAIVVLFRKWNWWAPGPLQRVKRDKNGKVIIRGGGKIEDDDLSREEE